MGQRSSDAAVKDVRIMLKQVECALGMGQRFDNAVVRDV